DALDPEGKSVIAGAKARDLEKPGRAGLHDDSFGQLILPGAILLAVCAGAGVRLLDNGPEAAGEFELRARQHEAVGCDPMRPAGLAPHIDVAGKRRGRERPSARAADPSVE